MRGNPRHCALATGITGRFPWEFCDKEAPLAWGGLTAYGVVKKRSSAHPDDHSETGVRQPR